MASHFPATATLLPPEYRIIELSVNPGIFENLGTKEKFWFTSKRVELFFPRYPKGRWFLFKAIRPNTGEDWAERIVCELCALLEIPRIRYEMAYINGKTHGVICPTFVPSPVFLVHGNELLANSDVGYPKQQKYKVQEHTVDAVASVLRQMQPPLIPDRKRYPPGLTSALDYFVGYVLLDAWVANQDRHHENWAGVRYNSEIHLAPTFDHGAALAHNISDKERRGRLAIQDKRDRYSISVFSAKAKSAFFHESKLLTTFAAWEKFAQFSPKSSKFWLEQLKRIDDDAVRAIIDKVPAKRMSGVTKDFTHQLLCINRQRLLEGAGL